ncbi:MAG: tRNA uridine-5-carboxymethylaminomethyl(34) synthesis GTPase MnmE [Sphingobium sp.]|nr:MAG: tRNA uridine-5-carboxymethylaminomethyl(34) synthesis GTPase MnmE [Sphingobium sp.]
MSGRDTIFALSSGQPPAGIGIIRISGAAAGDVLRTLSGRMPPPRRATLALLRNPVDSDLLDQTIMLWFPGPGSVTGEDLAELHCHGGRAVIQSIMGVLGTLPGLRMAEPGEFTRRAFENGRIDLSEAEGLGDLLLAETESQRRGAMAMADGHFSRRIEGWRDTLLALSAQVEAALDFSDEDDVPDAGIEERIGAGIADLAQDVRGELARPHAERLRDGVRVAIAGPPNAGKSTLLNALVGRDAAIVSDIAGTTRDRIEVPAAIGGIAFLFTDTAGLRPTEDVVEAIGIDRARQAMAAADILLWLGDIENVPEDAVVVAAQSDRSDRRRTAQADIAVSAHTGEGMEALVQLLIKRARKLLPREGEYALHARQRQGVAALLDALSDGDMRRDMLVTAEQLRLARTAIDTLIGRTGTEDMLDALFGRFCIGK